jgi:hypothetical protein
VALINGDTFTVTSVNLLEPQYAVGIDISTGIYYSEGIGDLNAVNAHTSAAGQFATFPCPLTMQCGAAPNELGVDSALHVIYASFEQGGNGIVLVYEAVTGRMGAIPVPRWPAAGYGYDSQAASRLQPGCNATGHPATGRDHHPGGAEIRYEARPARASSGDHAQWMGCQIGALNQARTAGLRTSSQHWRKLVRVVACGVRGPTFVEALVLGQHQVEACPAPFRYGTGPRGR